MTILQTGVSLPLNLKAGETLVIKELSGTSTVTGSVASREDASASIGAGFYSYGPQSADCSVTITTTGTCDWVVRVGDATPATDTIKTQKSATGQTVLDPVSQLLVPTSQITRAAQRYKLKYKPANSRAFAIGDSYAAGSGATTGAQAWYGVLSAELASAFGWNNYGFGGRPISAYVKAAKQAGADASNAGLIQPQIDDVYMSILGLNDLRGITDLGGTSGGCGPDPANFRQMASRAQAMATWFMIPETSRVRAKTLTNSGANPAVTYYTPSTAWNHGGALNGWANVSYSGVANSTATFTSTYGDLLVMRLCVASGASAVYSITVDGTVLYTGTSKGEFDSWALDCVILKLPTKGTHTVVLTHVSGDNVVFHSCDCVDTATDFSATFLYSTPNNLPDAAGAGWSNAGGAANGATANSATAPTSWLYNAGGLARFRQCIEEAMSDLYELGFNVVNVRHWTNWNLNTHLNADNVHPNDAGHALIANKFRIHLRSLIGI